ncbi:unnamed protein product [Jaminaea pallidilutea]
MSKSAPDGMTAPENGMASSSSVFSEALSKLTELAESHHRDALALPTIASPSALSDGLKSLPCRLPGQGWGLDQTTTYLLDSIAPTLATGQSATRYFGFVTGGVLPIAQLADWFVSLVDANVQVHLPQETLSTLIEAYTVRLLCQLLRIEEDKWTGTITTGATTSNVLGLLCAREQVIKTVAGDPTRSFAEEGYGASTPTMNIFVAQPHASIKKAAAIVGIGRSRVQDVGRHVSGSHAGSDPLQEAITHLDFDLELLETKLQTAQQLKQGSIVVVGMGEVNTGALTDQIPSIRKLCDQYGAWLHVDAAFSAFICLLEDQGYGWISEHLNMADSITSDGHKQLNVPYDCGLFFVRKQAPGTDREESLLEEVLGTGSGATPAYLLSTDRREVQGQGQGQGGQEDDDTAMETARRYLMSLPSPLFRNLENSRRFRALPVYLTLLCHGRRGLQEIVLRNVLFARSIEKWMRQDPEASRCYEVLTPACPARIDDEQQRSSRLQDPQPWRGLWTTTVVLFRPNAETCTVEAFRDTEQGSNRLVSAIKATRKVYVSPTMWAGRGAVRIAVSNWRTGLEGKSASESQGDSRALAESVEQSEDYRVTIETLRAVMRAK